MNAQFSPLEITVYTEQAAPAGITPDLKGPGWSAFYGPEPGPGACGKSYLDPTWLSPAPMLVVCDVDSTVIEEEAIDELAARAGVEQQVAELTERAMRGKDDFATSLRKRVQLLAGLPASTLADVAAQVTIRPGVRELVSWVQSLGGQVGLVSGGFTPIVEVVANAVGANHFEAIDLEVVDGHLTGRVTGEVVTAESKRAFLERLHEGTGYRTVVLGDGANDLKMLRAADLGIGVNAKSIIREEIPNYLDCRSLEPVIGLLGQSG